MGWMYSHHKWTHDADEKLLHLYKDRDIPVAQIAGVLKVTWEAARSRLRRLGVIEFRNTKWTDEMDEKLKTLVQVRHSSAEIGDAMGKTRNAIIGRCHRLGLKLLGKRRGTHKARPRVIKQEVARKVVAVPRVEAVPAVRRAATFDLVETFGSGAAAHALSTMSPLAAALVLSKRGCKYPLDDGGMCGTVAVDLRSYCEEHHALTHNTFATRMRPTR